MATSNNEIVLSFHDSLLRKTDVDLLNGPHWLNDQIISFYFEYLGKILYENNKKLLFVSPEVTQCIKLVTSEEVEIFLSPLEANEKDFIFFALNDNDEVDRAGGSHWSLLFFSRSENKFYHCDSANYSNFHISQELVRKIKNNLNAKTSKLDYLPTLKQSNGYDCGIHVICMAEQLAKHICKNGSTLSVPTLTNETIKLKRQNILEIIKLLGGKIEE